MLGIATRAALREPRMMLRRVKKFAGLFLYSPVWLIDVLAHLLTSFE